MKKAVLGISVVAMGLLVSGCGAKGTQVLECSTTDNSTDGMEMTDTIVATYEDGDLAKLSMNYQITLGEEYADYMSMFVDSLTEEFSYLENQKGIILTNETNENILDFNIEADLTKMDDEAKEALDIVDDNSNYESTKKSFEEEGYTCK